MDIKSLIPLMLAGKNSDTVAPILNMMNGNGDSGEVQSKLISSLLNKNAGNSSQAEILAQALAGNGNRNKYPTGITPILGIVNDDILGRIIKYLNKK